MANLHDLLSYVWIDLCYGFLLSSQWILGSFACCPLLLTSTMAELSSFLMISILSTVDPHDDPFLV